MDVSSSPWLWPRHEEQSFTSSDPNDPGNTKVDPWAEQSKYARAMAYTCSAIVVLIALHNLAQRHLAISPSFLALSRYLAYKPTRSHHNARRRTGKRPLFLHGATDIRLPALGVSIFLAAFMAAFTIWAFIVKPYYRIDSTYGSPPLALRSGMMALGLLPFVFALASKVNFIAMLIGSSHERLQVFHQWASRFVLFLATVHTIPFIYQPLREGGMAGLKEYYFAESINITGTVAFALLFFLVFSSFRSLRNWSYTLWVTVHIIVALVFLAFMFIHCQMELTSWRYLWGAAALYGLSTFLRIIRSLNNSPTFSVCHAQLEALRSGATLIRIRTTAIWSPGQHVFLRFPTIRSLSNHPFTVISLPSPNGTMPNTMVLMARRKSGLTARLHQKALDGPIGADRICEEESLGLRDGRHKMVTLPVIVDGPYGVSASVGDFDEVLMIAGGSGITFVVASLLDLTWQWHRSKEAEEREKRVRVIWSIQDEECAEWVKAQFEAVQAILPSQALQITIHVTRSERSRVEDETDERKGEGIADTSEEALSIPESRKQNLNSGEENFTIVKSEQRVDVAMEVRNFVNSIADESETRCSSTKRRAAIVACGPQGMSETVRAEAACIQLELVRGRLTNISELQVLSEQFGW